MPYWKGVINTANSLVGSSMLAMPFVLSKCGIILGSLLIITCGLLCEALRLRPDLGAAPSTGPTGLQRPARPPPAPGPAG